LGAWKCLKTLTSFLLIWQEGNHMKSALKLAATAKTPTSEPLLSIRDVEDDDVRVTQVELLEAVNAEYIFRVARADYEKRRAAIALKLSLSGDVEPGDWSAKLDVNGNLLFTSECGCCRSVHGAHR
jgi:hypothetical protein